MSPKAKPKQDPMFSSVEIREMLETIDIFEPLSDTDLGHLIAAGKQRRLKRGQYLFKANDSPDTIHVLLDGAIEVVRSTPDSAKPIPVAYLSPGEAIGDMGIFTGTARRSSGRVPEFAEVLTLTLQDLRDLTDRVPGYGLELAKVFAKRLEGFIKSMRGRRRRKELSGTLKYFDLPTVLQTLVAAKQTGVLTITGSDGMTRAEVLLLDGKVDRARCGMLEGNEAVYQLFHHDDSGEFFFRTMREPDAESISTIRISLSAINLLMEAMRLVDEFPIVRQRLPDPDIRYQTRTKKLKWEDKTTLAVAKVVLAKLKKPRTIPELVDEVPCSAFTLYRVAAELYESEQIS